MIYTVVGCGDTAKDWVPNGVSIGSNDCEKFGRGVNYLVLANHPGKFKADRIKTIKASKAKVLTTSQSKWKAIFPMCTQLQRVVAFNVRLIEGFVYTARTTPIMCVSLAIRMGATTVILWGVDMRTHHAYYEGSKRGNAEIALYKRFFAACKVAGVDIYLGSHGTAFDKVLPLWTTAP
jgi:hypothetical protein